MALCAAPERAAASAKHVYSKAEIGNAITLEDVFVKDSSVKMEHEFVLFNQAQFSFGEFTEVNHLMEFVFLGRYCRYASCS
jgi:hypothetical protein